MVVIFYFPVTSNPCDAPVNPCLSDGVSHTCRLQSGGTFKCKCKDGYVNDAAGKYCVSKYTTPSIGKRKQLKIYLIEEHARLQSIHNIPMVS